MNARNFRVLDQRIGHDHPPFIIAEMSGNHNGSFERAMAIVEAAAKAGVHALKLQTYTADTMTLNASQREFYVNDPKSLWYGESLYKLYQKASTPWEWHKPIFKRCRELGMIGFSTPFDATAVDFLEKLRVPLFKISSFENIDLPLIRRVAATGKPMVISTGMASAAEVEDAVEAAQKGGCKALTLLKCTSSYPTSPKESNLNTIPHMQQLFKCQIGLSDHTLGIGASLAAVALGATVIERHFTLSRQDGGVDAAFSLEPHEMKTLVEQSRIAWQAMGHVHYGPTLTEKNSIVFRRSLYVTKDMKAGDVLTPRNLRAIRPGSGLSPKYQDRLFGKILKRNARKGTPMSWDLVL